MYILSECACGVEMAGKKLAGFFGGACPTHVTGVDCGVGWLDRKSCPVNLGGVLVGPYQAS